jgi:hypothetical protein
MLVPWCSQNQSQNWAFFIQKRAKLRSHIAHPKKGRTHAHRKHVLKVFSHAHRTHASVRARVRIFFRNSLFEIYYIGPNE